MLSLLHAQLRSPNYGRGFHYGIRLIFRNLHTQIDQLHFEQYTEHLHSDSFVVYRGQRMPQTDFYQLIKTEGGYYHSIAFYRLVRFDKILLALLRKLETSDEVGILFVITVDPSVRSTPFANIYGVSCYQTEEEEIQFTMHSVFRVGQIKQINRNNSLWKVNLTLTSDIDPQLHALTEHIRKETIPKMQGWYRLDQVLIKLDQFDKAEQIM